MNPTSEQPVWACPEWGPDHNWHECLQCLAEDELMIERAQEWGEEPAEPVAENSDGFAVAEV